MVSGRRRTGSIAPRWAWAVGALGLIAGGLLALPRGPSVGVDDWQGAIAVWRHPEPLPDLPLTDQDGERFGLHGLAGSWVLVGFVFTRCGDAEACPLTMQHLANVQHAWTSADPSLQILVLTLDPEHDTPERLAAYAARFDLTPGPDVRLATGPTALMREGLPSLFNVLALPGPAGIEHTVKLTLLRPDLTVAAEWKDGGFDVARLRAAMAP